MPEYRTPGVYAEEAGSTIKPIEGAGTSTVGFVGATERGPTAPRLVTSLAEYQRLYGGTIDPAISFLPFAVQGFFDNGGRRAVIARVANVPPGARPATAEIGGLRFTARGPGGWGNRVRIWVLPAGAGAGGRTAIQLAYFGDEVSADALAQVASAEAAAGLATHLERFDDLSGAAGDAPNVQSVIDAASALVGVAWLDEAAERPALPVADGPGTSLAGAEPEGPLDGATLEGADGAGTAATGLAALRSVREVSLVCVPDQAVHPEVADGIIAQCDDLRDRFAILQGAKDWRTAAQFGEILGKGTSAAVYHPWVRVPDPRRGGTLLVPPGGHVAGIFARTDAERGVHEAPADAIVRGVVADGGAPLAVLVNDREQDLLNPRGVNVIRDFRGEGRGIRLWGARTISSDPEWKYVAVRRLLIFLEASIDEGTRWVAFEPNEEATWAQVRRQVAAFLSGVWRSGALAGPTADKAFFVRCDRTTMTDADIAGGRLVCLVGAAPVRAAEFVLFRICRRTAPPEP